MGIAGHGTARSPAESPVHDNGCSRSSYETYGRPNEARTTEASGDKPVSFPIDHGICFPPYL